MPHNVHIDDEQLVTRLQQGDQKAFTDIYKKYHDSLYLYAFKLTDDEAEASDLVQELFIYIWDKREQIKLNSSLRAYLYRSIRHKFLNLADHRRVRAAFTEQFQAYLDQGADSTSAAMDEKELTEYLEKLVSRLPGKMGRVFELRQQNCSDEEIADKLNVSEKTVKNLMSQAIKKLRSKLRLIIFFFFVLF